MAAVGGYTSVLELKPEEAGFNRANSLLKELYNNLKMVHDLAGNLGNMKLIVKFDNGQSSELNRIAQEERRKQSEQNKILKEKEREFKLHGGGVLNTYPKPKILDTDIERSKNEKESNKQLKDFASTLKWTIGVLFSFKSALALIQSVTENSNKQSSIVTQSMKYNTDPMAIQTLRRISQIYNKGDETGFNTILQKLFQFKYEPGLRGKLDTDTARDISNGLGTTINSEMFDKEPVMDIMFRIFKGYSEKQKSSDAGVRSRATLALESLFGDSGMALSLSSKGIDLQSAYNKNYGLSNDTTTGAMDVSIESGRAMANFGTIWDKFMTQIGTSLLDPLKRVNDWLESNRTRISGITQGISDVFGFFGDILTLGDPLGVISKQFKKGQLQYREEEGKGAVKSGFNNSDQYFRLKSSGIFNSFLDSNTGTVFIDGKSSLSKKEIIDFEKKYKSIERLKKLSSIFGTSQNGSTSDIENSLASGLKGQILSGSEVPKELQDAIDNNDIMKRTLQYGTGGTYGDQLYKEILNYIKKVETMEGKVEILLHMPDGSTKKETISMKKSQSMNRDNYIAQNMSLMGSGLA